jgi:phosphoribosylglycinamide formyltransferase 1
MTSPQSGLNESRIPNPESRPLRIAVLASGRGSNLQALIDARDAGKLPIELVGLFSDRPVAPAMERACAAGIPALALRPKDFASREAFDAALFDAVEQVQPGLIVCAGFMRIIADAQVARFEGRMINIHPSLLPKYPGLHTHARALEAGDAEHGASVHFVIPALDAGPVLAQARVPVLADDTPETLAERVLAREHPLLLAAVAVIASGRVRADAERIWLDDAPLASPLQLDTEGRLHA